MRIAHIGLRGVPAKYSGIERAVDEIGARLVACGHDVTVYCMAGHYPEKPASHRGIRLRYVPTVPTKNLEMIVYSFLSTISASLQSYDVLHFHALGPSTMAYIPRLLRKKTVVTVHGLDWQREKWGRAARMYLKFGEYASWRFPHETIVVSRSLQSHYGRHHGRIAHYIPNGVGHQQYAELHQAAARFSVEKRKYLVYVGRLTPEKNIHLLIEAFRSLNSNMKLLIVGGGSETSYLEQLQALAARDSRVVLTGPLYGECLEELVSNAFLFVLPSSIEGLPVALLEALCQGVPALVSDIAENVEVLHQGAYDRGFVCPVGNPSALEGLLRSLLDNPDQVERKRGIGKESLQQEYDWDRITDETLRIYSKLADPKSTKVVRPDLAAQP